MTGRPFMLLSVGQYGARSNGAVTADHTHDHTGWTKPPGRPGT